MRKIKHFAGYGTVKAGVIKDNSCTLHIRVEGNHERGIMVRRDDESLLYTWLVKRFDKSVPDFSEWYARRPIIDVRSSFRFDPVEGYVDICNYYFTY